MPQIFSSNNCMLALLLYLSVSSSLSCSAQTIAEKKTMNQGKTDLSLSKQNLESAYFAGGCFWKVQYILSKVPGVIKTTAGYTGGHTANPNYEQVCGHGTGHAETVKVDFDPNKVTYKKLLETFLSNHDPTTLNRQGPDVGDQYRSEIFYANQNQKDEAVAYIAQLEKTRKFSSPIVTKIEAVHEFYPAEGYHQDYFVKHGRACD